MPSRYDQGKGSTTHHSMHPAHRDDPCTCEKTMLEQKQQCAIGLLNSTHEHGFIVAILLGWAYMVTGHSFVLWPRLYLVLCDPRSLEWIRNVLIFNGIVIHTYQSVATVGHNDHIWVSNSKCVAYGIKLKIEFWILSQLKDFTNRQGTSILTGEDDSYAYHSAGETVQTQHHFPRIDSGDENHILVMFTACTKYPLQCKPISVDVIQKTLTVAAKATYGDLEANASVAGAVVKLLLGLNPSIFQIRLIGGPKLRRPTGGSGGRGFALPHGSLLWRSDSLASPNLFRQIGHLSHSSFEC
ncbi:hypothetical protein B0J13DRAFT_645864 [Dactylonectria estremocensis]|uniref:DUF7703 domain-containing protein n=1 Tax=Dactylonectria estremocensis TaxID=1079267 RepID=A0A9P9DZC2_9HYPO|nr:hypothetical protein B0J13DRAFT_645864 [Dactylonectria estremocensis]